MAEITVHEIFSVCVQVDASYPDETRLRPRVVWFDNWPDAAAAMNRALGLLPPGITTAMVSRERVDKFDSDEDADLDDWPAERHVVKGPMTAEDFE